MSAIILIILNIRQTLMNIKITIDRKIPGAKGLGKFFRAWCGHEF